jgi:hypothetical protein
MQLLANPGASKWDVLLHESQMFSSLTILVASNLLTLFYQRWPAGRSTVLTELKALLSKASKLVGGEIPVAAWIARHHKLAKRNEDILAQLTSSVARSLTSLPQFIVSEEKARNGAAAGLLFDAKSTAPPPELQPMPVGPDMDKDYSAFCVALHPSSPEEAKLRCEAIDEFLTVEPWKLCRPQGAKDARCREFDPDLWQQRLLDIVDRNESVLVSAPTSSGKTFIAFYAIERTLLSCVDVENVVVYLAPTKVLVELVEAEAFARFDKKFKHAGPALAGDFTEEYRNRENSCNLLAATPEAFEELLLTSRSPYGRNWLADVKWIIFDEVHRIGSSDGQTWERIVNMVDCPFLALSATLGDLTNLHQWLCRVEQERPHRRAAAPVHLIVHNERWNDLDVHFWTSASPTKLHAAVGDAESWPHGDANAELRQRLAKSESCLEEVNPIFCLAEDLFPVEGWKSNLKLLPEHCVQILRFLENDDHPLVVESVQRLRAYQAHLFQGDSSTFATASALRLEAAVKSELTVLAQSPAAHEKVRKLTGSSRAEGRLQWPSGPVPGGPLFTCLCFCFNFRLAGLLALLSICTELGLLRWLDPCTASSFQAHAWLPHLVPTGKLRGGHAADPPLSCFANQGWQPSAGKPRMTVCCVWLMHAHGGGDG